MIHPTAIVSPDADIADVEIGAYSIIGEDVTIGKGTWIGPHVVIDPHVTIGPGCRIFQYAAIGAIPQDLKFGGETSYVKSART
jgi:UDP-N-acetylglucosamine acyltransferase